MATIDYRFQMNETDIVKNISSLTVDDWLNISKYQVLSNDFINCFAQYLDWNYICINQILSEECIQSNKKRVCWKRVSKFQHLSKPFIRKNRNKVDWLSISSHQKLSESFIEEFKCKVDWESIAKYQKLSGEFIEKNFDSFYWRDINIFQKLSEEFILKNRKKLSAPLNERYQRSSTPKKYIIEWPFNWLYKDKEFKRQAILNCGLYEIEGDYVIAYKTTRRDGYSVYNFQYRYEVGKTYEAHADYNLNNTNSFGLSAWTRDDAIGYHHLGKLFKVAIHLDDLASLTDDGKLRASKLMIVEELNNNLLTNL